MLKIDKRLHIGVQPGTVTERMATYLEESEKAGFVSYIERLRRWSIIGFQLQELGGGVLEGWQAMERNGELDGMSRAQKARILSDLLQRVIDSEETETKAGPTDPPKEPKKKSISQLSNINNHTT